MRTLKALSLRLENNHLYLLDQTLLPQQEKWIKCDTLNVMLESIQHLRVRGAPLIGIAAALYIAVAAFHGVSRQSLVEYCHALRKSRPTAVNLMYCIDSLLAILNDPQQTSEHVIQQAYKLFDEDIALCDAIAKQGVVLISQYKNIMTYCNTGGLATAGCGTALGIIKKSYCVTKDHHIWINETRPLLQGSRLTSWECSKSGIPATLLCDNMAATLMRQGAIDCVIVGADRIVKNGDFANKIGTYALAVAAKAHNIPFYVAAPSTSYDSSCACGDDIEIEQRSSNEVLKMSLSNIEVYNPAFDITPGKYVTGYISEKGILKPPV